MNSNSRVEYIDAWRFFAIALVITSHLVEFSHPFYREALPGLGWRIHLWGPLGVHVFFCVSGYVICRGMAHEANTYGSFSMRNFYIRRAFRILPPLAAYLLFLAAMAQAGVIDVALPQFARAAAFVCNLHIGDCGWYLSHTWSLAYEEQFYLIFPVLFVAIALARRRARLVAIVLLLVAASVAARLMSHPELAFYLSIFSYMLWGCVYAFYQDALQPRLQKMPVPLWVGLGLLLLGLNFIALPELFRDIVYPLFAPLAICALVFATPLRHPAVRAVFTNRWIAYLGQISYTVYLWQQAATKDYGLASPVVAVMLCLLVFVLAHFSYKYFELPLIRLGRTWCRSRTAPATAPVTGAVNRLGS